MENSGLNGNGVALPPPPSSLKVVLFAKGQNLRRGRERSGMIRPWRYWNVNNAGWFPFPNPGI